MAISAATAAVADGLSSTRESAPLLRTESLTSLQGFPTLRQEGGHGSAGAVGEAPRVGPESFPKRNDSSGGEQPMRPTGGFHMTELGGG